MTPQRIDWRQVALEASKENDPQRLYELVCELNRLLDPKYRERQQHAESTIVAA